MCDDKVCFLIPLGFFSPSHFIRHSTSDTRNYLHQIELGHAWWVWDNEQVEVYLNCHSLHTLPLAYLCSHLNLNTCMFNNAGYISQACYLQPYFPIDSPHGLLFYILPLSCPLIFTPLKGCWRNKQPFDGKLLQCLHQIWMKWLWFRDQALHSYCWTQH